MPHDTSNRRPRGDTALKGLIGGFGLGVLNVIAYLFFVIPIVAHDIFHTYVLYDASTVGYAAAYVGILGLLGIPIALFTGQVFTKRTAEGTDVGHALLRRTPVDF